MKFSVSRESISCLSTYLIKSCKYSLRSSTLADFFEFNLLYLALSMIFSISLPRFSQDWWAFLWWRKAGIILLFTESNNLWRNVRFWDPLALKKKMKLFICSCEKFVGHWTRQKREIPLLQLSQYGHVLLMDFVLKLQERAELLK